MRVNRKGQSITNPFGCLAFLSLASLMALLPTKSILRRLGIGTSMHVLIIISFKSILFLKPWLIILFQFLPLNIFEMTNPISPNLLKRTFTPQSKIKNVYHYSLYPHPKNPSSNLSLAKISLPYVHVFTHHFYKTLPRSNIKTLFKHQKTLMQLFRSAKDKHNLCSPRCL